LKSTSDQLVVLEERVIALTVRLNASGKCFTKLERQLADLTEQNKVLWKNWIELKKSYDEHCRSDGQWWRKALDSIMNDIDDLRSDGCGTTPSPACSGSDRSG